MGKGIGESQIWAFLAVFLGLIGFILVLLAKRNDKYAMYYAKQSLVLMIAGILLWIVSVVTMFILVGFILAPVGGLIMLVLWIIALINSLSGSEKPTPLIGKYAEKFKF